MNSLESIKKLQDVPLGVVVVVEGERFERLGRWYDDSLPSNMFRRVDGGYNVMQGQIDHLPFAIEGVTA